MSVFDKVKRTIKDNLPDVVTNSDITGQTGEMIWKYDRTNALIRSSRLIVGESQEAIFVKGGVIEEIFGPGSYDLDTPNIPIMKTLLNKAYGGENPNTAEIWFVNKSSIMEVPWGTPNPINIEDARYGFPITIAVRCNGTLALKVVNARALFTELAGQGKRFSVEAFRDSIKGIVTSKLRRAIKDMLQDKQYSFIALQNNINDLEEPIQTSVCEEIDRFGVMITGCYVRGFSPVNDANWQRYLSYENKVIDQNLDITLEATRKRTLEIDLESERMQKFNIDYRTERQLDVMQTAAGNASNPAVSMGVGFGVGGAVASSIAQGFPSLGQAAAPAQAAPFQAAPAQNAPSHAAPSAGAACPKCSAALQGTPKFCPECGFVLMKICAACRATINGNPKFCPECGKKSNFCPECGVDNAPDAVSCAKCGASIARLTQCPGCGFVIDGPMKFCPECGSKF